jgi:hypothetical protein
MKSGNTNHYKILIEHAGVETTVAKGLTDEALVRQTVRKIRELLEIESEDELASSFQSQKSN